jgi:hypothetical protein
MARHPHADLMIAYANDDTLEFEVLNAGKWESIPIPTFAGWCQYRIKPKPVQKVEMWQWVYRTARTAYGGVRLTESFYKSAEEAQMKIDRSYTVIGKADWTRIEVEEE